MVEQYICSKAEGCEYAECAHRTPHDSYECRAPKGHRDLNSPSCGAMPEFCCVPVSKLAKKLAS